jgi:hypothetical protein
MQTDQHYAWWATAHRWDTSRKGRKARFSALGRVAIHAEYDMEGEANNPKLNLDPLASIVALESGTASKTGRCSCYRSVTPVGAEMSVESSGWADRVARNENHLEDGTMAKAWCLLASLVMWNLASALAAEQAEQAAEHGYPVIGESTVTPESLRAEGPAGLERALRAHDGLQDLVNGLNQTYARLSREGFEQHKEELEKISEQLTHVKKQITGMETMIDQVGGQRGCSVSRLYWYTDLNEAKAEAERRGRPILSLRMLGKLTDEYSCANSRFFRTALYSNKEISDLLRTNFVLHWQSVRPVPKVTIDFGDGRKLERTLTGNSAHYVLASDGTPLDVLPGLYGPLAFRQWLWDVRDFHDKYVKASMADRTAMLQAFHRAQENAILRRWDADIQRLGGQRTELVSTRIAGAMEAARLAGRKVPAGGPAPKAVAAATRAVGKTQAEAPLLRFANLGGAWMERGMDDDLWLAIANLHRQEVKLDAASVGVMAREFPRAAVAGQLSVSKRAQENPILRLVRSFEDSMTLDTVRNEYLLHRRIHEKFAHDKTRPTDVDTLNEWVYAELFLTPSNDPWLGLAPNDVYTALENDGRSGG